MGKMCVYRIVFGFQGMEKPSAIQRIYQETFKSCSSRRILSMLYARPISRPVVGQRWWQNLFHALKSCWTWASLQSLLCFPCKVKVVWRWRSQRHSYRVKMANPGKYGVDAHSLCDLVVFLSTPENRYFEAHLTPYGVFAPKSLRSHAWV